MRKQLLLSFATLLIALLASVQLASAQTTYLLNEDFNSLTSGIPSGWDNQDGTTTTDSYKWNYHSSGHTGACVRFNSYSNYTGLTNMLKTPAVDLSTGEWILTFWYKNPAAGDFSVYISTDGGSTYTTSLLTGLTGVSDWTYQRLNITSAANASSNVKIVFQGTSNYGYNDAYIYLDDVTIESAPTCKGPEGLTISNLTTTSATLNWNLGAEGCVPTKYTYTLTTTSGTVIESDNALVAPTMTYNIAGLAPNTTYIASLTSNCNDSAQGLSNVATITFTTLCNAQSAPYVSDFSSLPSCSHYANMQLSTAGRTGNCLQFTTEAAANAYIVFPELTLRSDTVEATIWVKVNSASAGTSSVQVGLVTDPADVGSSFEALYNGTLTNTSWNEIRFNTSATTQPITNTSMIAVVFPQVADLTYYIDDVSIHAIPTCIRPEQFSVSNITATTADFSWTQAGDDAHIYAMTATDTTIFSVSTNPATITGLTPNTNYTFQIRGICSASDSSELSPIALTGKTQCLIATTPLFLQDFESVTSANTAPDCWNMGWIVKPSGNTKAAPFSVSGSQFHSGSKSMTLVDQTQGSLSYLSSQQLPIDSTGKYTLSVWVYRQNASSYPTEGLRFWVNTIPNDTAGGTLLGYVPRHYASAPAEAAYNMWYNYEYVINRTGNLYVIVEGVSQYGSSTYFDDVQVKITPSCMKVTNIALSTPTATDVDLTWQAGKDETQWIVNYTLTQGATTIETVTDTVNTSSINIDGLLPATVYNITGTVTAYCGGTDVADAVSFNQTFVSACQGLTSVPYTCGFESAEVPTGVSNAVPYCWNRINDATGTYGNTYPYVYSSNARTGSQCLYFYSSTSTSYADNEVAVLPELNTTSLTLNTLRLVFYAKLGSSSYTGQLYVGMMADPDDLTTFTVVDSFAVSGTDYTKFETQFTNYVGNGTYMAIWMPRGSGSFSLYVDDVSISTIPTCADLAGAGVAVSDVSDVSAKLTLTDQTATNWSYAYGAAGTPAAQLTAVDATGVITLTGLTPQTNYVVYARRQCGTEYGAWSDGVNFTTACGAASVPYTDDFENTATGALAGCYTVSGGSSYETLSVMSGTDFNHTASGSKGVSVEYYGSATNVSSEYSVLAYVHLDATKNYEIAAYAKQEPDSYWGSNYDWQLAFVYGSAANSLNTISTSVVNQTSFTRYNSYFNVPTTGDYYIGFKSNINGDNYSYYLYIDDITINEVSCIPPTSTNVIALTSDSANIGFTSTGATQWEVAVSTSPIDIEDVVIGEIYHDTVNTASFAVGGLSVNTLYYYTIRTLCSQGGTSSWMQPQTFRTQCSAFNLPYSEGFETVGSTLCWTNTGGTGSIARDGSVRHTGNGSMLVTAASAASPELNVVTLASDMITGWAYAETAGTTFSVGVMTNLTDASTYTDLTTVTIPSANTWYEFTCPFSLLTDPEYSDFYNARYVVLVTGQASIYFDDLIIDDVPTCPKPNQGTITNVTAHGATIGWTETGTATSWRVRVAPASGAAVSQTVNTTPSATFTGLNAATTYSVYVRALCNATDSSYEYLVGNFTTDCDYVNAPYYETFDNMTVDQTPTCWDISASTTSTATSIPKYVWGVFSTGNGNAIRLNNYNCMSGLAVINTPEIILEAGKNYEVKYEYCNQTYSTYYLPLDLIVKIKRHSDAAFTQLASHGSSSSSSQNTPEAFLNNGVNISSYAGDTVQIQFYADANYGAGAVFVDNVRVRELSDCSEPTSVTVSGVASSSATVIFGDTCAAHNTWQYVCGTTGFDPDAANPITVTSDTIQITGLTPATSYDVYVRAVCSTIDFSTWNTASFRTTAVAPAFPYSCDFSDQTENGSWVNLGSGQSAFVMGNDADAAFETGGSALYVAYGGSYGYNTGNSSQVGMSRVFLFTSNSYNISFDWKCSGGESSYDFARFYLVPATDSPMPTGNGSFSYLSWPSNLIPLDGGTYKNLTTGDQHVDVVLDMTGREGSYNLVFVWCNDGSAGSNYPLSVSNINISELTCQLVTNPTVISSTLNSVQATCTNPNAGASVRWAISTSSLVRDTLMSGIAAADTFTINGLSPSTGYYLFLRAECSAVDQSPWIYTPFNTACGVVSSYPFVQDFEQTTFPPVCWTNTSLTSSDYYGTTLAGNWIRGNGDSYYGSGNGTGWAEMEGYGDASALLSTPALHLDSARDYHVSFSLYRLRNYSYSSYDDELRVYVGTNANSKVGATLIASYVVGDDNVTQGLATYDVDIPSSLSGDLYVLFEGVVASSSYSATIYLDDITVDQYPLCRDLTAAPTVVGTSATTVTVSAPMNSCHSQIQFGIAPYSASATVADITSTVLSDATGTAVFTGLTANTNYSVFARGICAAYTDTTAWTKATKATTKVDDCYAPDGVHVIGLINDTVVTIGWNAVPDVTSNTYQCCITSGSVTDSVTVTGTQVTLNDLTPNTSYSFTVRGFCGTTDTTAWSTAFTFKTVNTPAYIPYSTGFETSDDNAYWVITNSARDNKFIFGSDANGRNGGNQGLYISSNNSTYSQSVPTDASSSYTDILSVSFITRTLRFPEAGTYNVSFDWKCDPQNSTGYYTDYYAYGRAFLAPVHTNYTVDDGTYAGASTVPAGGIVLGKLTGSQTWQNAAYMVTVTDSCYMDMVFMYYSLNSYGWASTDDASDYPLAVDNFAVEQILCTPVSTISTFGVSDTFASALVYKTSAVDIQYAILTVGNKDSITTYQSLSSASMTDTLSFTGLNPSTTYYIFVRTVCDSTHISPWRSVSFRTTGVPAVLPYICDFETTAENNNWNFVNGNTNQFIIGSATSNGGTQALYVTDDGTSYNYDETDNTYSYAYRVFYLTPGLYEYSYDCNANGGNYDYGRAFLAPADAAISATSALASSSGVPAGGIALDGNASIHGLSGYVTKSDTFTVTQANSYNLVFYWYTMGWGSNVQPPLGIDNISLKLSTCPFPVGQVDASSITKTSATAVVTNMSPNSQLVYAVSATGNFVDAILVDTLPYNAAPDTLNLTGLSPSSSYKLMLRSICDSADESMWNRIAFKTLCGTINSYPYTESFETVAGTYTQNMIHDLCWTELKSGNGSVAYNATTSYSPADGEKCLLVKASPNTALVLVLPEMDSINNLQLSFKYKDESTSNSCGIFYGGYVTDPDDASSFVTVFSGTRVSDWAQANVTFANVPDSARLAIKYSDANSYSWYGFLDDVRVTQVYRMEPYNDTVCYNKPYTLHGFNISASQMSVGNNTFTRTDAGVGEGAKDTLYTANVYMRANIVANSADTICAGRPYTVGQWNIQNPYTHTYRQTFQNAASCGCDSTVSLSLVVIPTRTTTNDTICMGGSYQFGDTVITTAGTYFDYSINPWGCNDTTVLNLFVADTAVMFNDTICQAAVPYYFEGQSLFTTDTYRAITTGAHGCPLAKTLNLYVVPDDSIVNVSFCQGGIVQVEDTFIQHPGYYTIVRVGRYNCNITFHITATEIAPTPVEVYDYACEGHLYTGHGISGLTVTQDTVITVTRKTLDNSCDSVTNVNLTYIHTVYSDTTAYIKEGESFTWHNNTYKTAGDYTDNMQSVVTGCDSIVTLHLVVSGTGVDNVDDITINIVPNPVEPGATAFVYGNFSEAVNVEILNSFGQVIDSFEPVGYPIEVNGITASGLYYVRITSRDGSVHLQKLIVK